MATDLEELFVALTRHRDREDAPTLQALLDAIAGGGSGGGSGWYEGAVLDRQKKNIPAASTNEQHRITIPAGTNKLIPIRASSVGVSQVPGNSRPCAVQYIGAAYRDAAGVLKVEAPGLNALSPPFGATLSIYLQQMTVDGDDIVVIGTNDQKETGTLSTVFEYAIVDSDANVDV